MHPERMLSILRECVPIDATLILDGGDILSFARVALAASYFLDPGSFGCLGVGVPFGIAAALARPQPGAVVLSGDGSFGFNAMEIDTAVRHKANVIFVIANNGAWQIEVQDQIDNYHRVVGTRLQFSDHAAMARAFGMYAERVNSADDLAAAYRRAEANMPALIDVVLTPEAISSDSRQGLAWGPGLQALLRWDDAEMRWRDGEPVKKRGVEETPQPAIG
jgi:acetolactate synthase-1/2/3 large subunit